MHLTRVFLFLVRAGGNPRRARFQSVRLAAALCLLAALTVRADDNEDLHALAGLTGTNYVTQRNFLLSSHPDPYDVASAAAYSWGAGLAAYILDAWQTDPADFTNWAAYPMYQREEGGYGRSPAIAAGTNGQVFLIEQVWKTAPVSDSVTDAVTALFKIPLDGPLALWQAVDTATPPGPPPGLPAPGDNLLQVAIHALASSPGQFTAPDAVVNALTNASAAEGWKIAALTGLAVRGPANATSLLLATQPSWSVDLTLLSYGFGALAAQTNSGGRIPLYTTAQDTNQPEEVRMTAITAFSATPLPGETTLLQGILTNGVPPEMSDQINDALEIYVWLDVPP